MTKFFQTKRDVVAEVFSFVLGLTSSASPVYTTIIASTIAILYLLVVVALPRVYPRALLSETRDQITDTRFWLDDEAITRHSSSMYGIAAQGLADLESIEKRVKALQYQHEKNFTMRKAIRYALALPKLVIDARKCQSDIITLRSDLEDEVHQLGEH